MIFTTNQLSELLKMPYRKTYRIATYLNFDKEIIDNKLHYFFTMNHPLMQSANVRFKYAKLIYTISDIASIWKWRHGTYSQERVRQLLHKYSVPIYNKENKGLIYLSDLIKILKTP